MLNRKDVQAPSSSAGDATGSLAAARRLHAACERFEADWKAARRPRAEDYLGPSDDPARTRFVEELTALEIELRRDLGEDPTAREFLRRFPDHADVIRSLFADGADQVEGLNPGGSVGKSPRATMGTEPGRAGSASTSTSASPSLGERFGKYELVAELARGGMGVVYKARDTALNREVAIKMILSGTLASETERERFRREASLAAKLEHPNVVPIYEVGEHDGFLYFTMRLVEGGSLAGRLGAYRDDPLAAARLIEVLARAVEYANQQGFIHCDLKPSNILIDRDGAPQITDFGLARQSTESSALTVSGAILGTPSYMAPEQASGDRKAMGPATDVHGLGAILYELLTGRPPFRMATMMETVMQAIYCDPLPPRELTPGLPRELEHICLKCLEKAPADRYSTAAALADELTRFLKGDAVGATGPIQNVRRWARREPEIAARLTGLALVSLLTEVNYRLLSPDPNPQAHAWIQVVLALWAALTLLFQFLSRQGWQSDRQHATWISADMSCLTMLLWIMRDLDTPLLIGYPLMIAASGLWFREKLVWITTALTIVGYGSLYLLAGVEMRPGTPGWSRPDVLPYANVFLACLALTGYVVSRLVTRVRTISQYYEARRGG